MQELQPLTALRPLVRWVALMAALSAVPVHAQPGLATYKLGSGWATFGFALPQGSAAGALQVGRLPTQTDVKTTWSDGSIRFAIVTAKVPSSGQYPITAGAARGGGTLAAVPPAIEVRFVMEGRTWVATFPGGAGDLWLEGPLVRETRAIVAPVANMQPHPFLRVIFDVRSYAGGGHRVDVTVENSLNVAEADKVTYDVDVVVNGRSTFRKSHVEHFYLARWRVVRPVGFSEAAVTPDFAPFVEARAIPSYLPTVDDREYFLGGAQFDILGTGDLVLPMNEHGGRPELAPYPDWTAQYVVHRHPDQRAYVLAHGNLAGSFSVHIKEPDGVRPISIDERPNFWLDSRADAGDGPKNGLRGIMYGAENSHQPSLAYVPYLLTGDRYYADEMRYWANFCLLTTFQDGHYNARGGSRGLLESNEVRGIGWALRNLSDTVYLPDADPDRAYFLEKVANNLRWLDDYARTDQAPLGTVFSHKRPENDARPPHRWIAVWEQTYLAWAIDHALQHGLSGGQQLRDRIVRFQLALFTSSDRGYPRDYGAPYVLAVGRRTDHGLSYYASLAEVFAATFGTPPSPPVEFSGAYGPEARLMLLIAIEQGWPEAAEALRYLMTPGVQQGLPSGNLYADLNRRSGWAIASVAPTGQVSSRWAPRTARN